MLTMPGASSNQPGRGRVATRVGFDNERYLEEQSQAIVDRASGSATSSTSSSAARSSTTIHAARVLPGYDPNVKIRLLQKLKDQAEIVVCIYAGAIERRRCARTSGSRTSRRVEAHRRPERMGTAGASGGDHALREPALGRCLQGAARAPRRPRLHPPSDQRISHRRRTDRQRRRLRSQRLHRDGAADRRRHRPRPGSGKLATCLSQLYHEHQRGDAPVTRSSRRSRSGTCRSSTRSTWPTRRPPRNCATST